MEEELNAILKKYNIEDMRITVTDTHGKIFTGNWTTEVKSTLKEDLLKLLKKVSK